MVLGRLKISRLARFKAVKRKKAAILFDSRRVYELCNEYLLQRYFALAFRHKPLFLFNHPNAVNTLQFSSGASTALVFHIKVINKFENVRDTNNLWSFVLISLDISASLGMNFFPTGFMTFRIFLFLNSHYQWEIIGFMWKITFAIFIKSVGINWHANSEWGFPGESIE